MNRKYNIKEFFKKRWYYIAISMLFLVIVLINIVPNSFAQKYAIRSIYITSENLNYEQKEGGSFHIEKSAEWKSYKDTRTDKKNIRSSIYGEYGYLKQCIV